MGRSRLSPADRACLIVVVFAAVYITAHMAVWALVTGR